MERQTVSSRQNPLIKFVCGLADKKRRTESGLFRFDGVKLLGEAVSARLEIKYIIYRELPSELTAELVQRALDEGLVTDEGVVPVTQTVFEKISEEHSPEGVITVAKMPTELHACVGEYIPKREEKILVAESLRDPGNLGTVIRSAYALGIERLILTDDCADIYNPRTLRAAMGAAFKLPTFTVTHGELPEYIGKLRHSGRRVLATALCEGARSIADMTLCHGDCFVIGNEGHGLSRECIDACTESVIIPMRDGAESLNAAAAAAICIWETVKA